jgi:hypothetical protein
MNIERPIVYGIEQKEKGKDDKDDLEKGITIPHDTPTEKAQEKQSKCYEKDGRFIRGYFLLIRMILQVDRIKLIHNQHHLVSGPIAQAVFNRLRSSLRGGY